MHHPLYHDLGYDDTERISTYKELFRHELEPGEIIIFQINEDGGAVRLVSAERKMWSPNILNILNRYVAFLLVPRDAH